MLRKEALQRQLQAYDLLETLQGQIDFWQSLLEAPYNRMENAAEEMRLILDGTYLHDRVRLLQRDSLYAMMAANGFFYA